MDARIIRSLVTADKAILAISGHYCGLDQFIAHVRRTATIRTDHGVACPVQTSGISPFFRPGQTKDCQASRSWIWRTLSEWTSRHYWHGWVRYAIRLTACLIWGHCKQNGAVIVSDQRRLRCPIVGGSVICSLACRGRPKVHVRFTEEVVTPLHLLNPNVTIPRYTNDTTIDLYMRLDD